MRRDASGKRDVKKKLVGVVLSGAMAVFLFPGVARAWGFGGHYSGHYYYSGHHYYGHRYYPRRHYYYPRHRYYYERHAYSPYGYAYPESRYQYAADAHGTNQFLGTILGGIGGGVLGAQIGKGRGRTAATVGGALLGVLVGNSIGRRLDARDRRALSQTTQRSLEESPSGQATPWRNPDSDKHGSVTPQPAFKNAQGEICRQYEQTVTIEGEETVVHGTACRQPDGTWKPVS